MEEVLKLENISKNFGSFKANENINFTLLKGELHTILGENGAGKSTLMNILTGLYHPDNGSIFLNGKEKKFYSPKDSKLAGIGMVHQEFHLSESHSVFDNIIIGKNDLKFFYNKKNLSKEINELCEKYNFVLNLKDKIWQLTVGEQQKVEILKVLYNDPKIIIFDEPTSVLTQKETEGLFTIISLLKNSGYSIIFISHKLEEVLRISDRITIISKGKVIDTLFAKGATKEELAEKMVGRRLLFSINKDIKPIADERLLEIEGVSYYNSRGVKALDNLSFFIKKCEIYGIAGVAGNGQIELADALYGLIETKFKKYMYNGREITKVRPREMMKLGISMIPSDRREIGAAIGMNIPENLILNKSRWTIFNNFFFLNKKNMITKAKESTEKFNIKYNSLSHPVRNLSGGNLQKVIVAREIDKKISLLIAVYPTRGLDVGAIESLREIFLEEQKKGISILLVSEDIEELLNLADRIGVMYNGKIIKTFERENFNPNEILLAMGGVT